MSIQTINFKNPEADLTTLGNVCRELEAAGLSPDEAAAEVLSQMAMQAERNGMDPTEVRNALFTVLNKTEKKTGQPAPSHMMQRVMSDKEVQALHEQMNAVRDLLLYWDMVLCAEIQRYAFQVLDKMKESGLYRHEMKKHVNKLGDEARRIQMRIKDNDRSAVVKWCSRFDESARYAFDFFNDGGTVSDKFTLAYLDRFKPWWDVVMLDCREAAKYSNTKHKDIASILFALEALTNTGVELYDTCVRRMKHMMTGKGTFHIRKSMHHENMRGCVNAMMRKLVTKFELPETQAQYAKKHLYDLQKSMIEQGLASFFQDQFDCLAEEFVLYMLSRIRMEQQDGKVSFGSLRMVFYRLGDKKRTRKFFKQLFSQPIPDSNFDVWDVMDSLDVGDKYPSVHRFFKMTCKLESASETEPQDKQEARLLRQQARRFNGLLPDDMLRVMMGYYKTKKALLEHLSSVGFELNPTIIKVQKIKASELKQM